MPPRNKAQKRKHSLLKYETEIFVKSKTRHSQITKTNKGLGSDDLGSDEDNNLECKGHESKARKAGGSSESRPRPRPTSKLFSASKSNSENESQTTTTEQTRKRLTVVRSDSGSNYGPSLSIKDKHPVSSNRSTEDELDLVRTPKRRKLIARTRQRSLLEYAMPVKGKTKQRTLNTDTGEEDTEGCDSNLQHTEEPRFGHGSESDSPQKIRFEPSLKTKSASSSKRTIHAISDSDVEEGIKSVTRIGRSRRRSESENSDENLFPSSKHRRLLRGRRPSFNRTGDGDLSSEDEQLIEEAKAKEYLRVERRMGEKSESEEDEDEDEGECASQKTDPSDCTSEVSRLGDIFADAKPTGVYKVDEECQDEDVDFIVEDDEPLVELPPMFNMGTFQDLSHHFKVVCQLFVHLSIKKRGHRTDFIKEALTNHGLGNYFSVPMSMIRRKLLGLRDSLVASSIWKLEFRKSLETYPDFTIQQLDFAVPHCDACNLGGRISTLQGLLRGTQYDTATYQNKTKEISLNWNLGRFCAARAQVFHKLTHWEYMLFHKLNLEINYLRKGIEDHDSESGRNIFIPASKGPPPPDDLTDADGLMEWLDGRGIIEAEWLEIKNMMDKAHKLEARGKRGEDDVEYS
ncbi:hypothetical protein Clacol_006362 [Clathrus columnatus]|uniref:DUF4211 domain-containing protein n=1 Tax=Clathrus columnatus TaxID=1419009 RepID=A0AAV5ABV5_9AGAM|nr:hypothetical protein Clacol_006362 [Clathrus columnatus]